MSDFKSFSPKADKQRRLVMTRFHSGTSKDVNSFCYQITRITKLGTVDKKFKPLFAYGTDDFDSVKEFKHSGNGETVKVFRKPFKSVFGVDEKNNPEKIWKKIK
jgi:hypothetical protein